MGRKKSKETQHPADKEVGARFRKVRNAMRPVPTLKAVAEWLGRSQSHYSKIESGNNPFEDDLLLTWCNLFDVPREWILHGHGACPQIQEDPGYYEVKAKTMGDSPSDERVAAAVRIAYEILGDTESRRLLGQWATQFGGDEVRALQDAVRAKLKTEGRRR